MYLENSTPFERDHRYRIVGEEYRIYCLIRPPDICMPYDMFSSKYEPPMCTLLFICLHPLIGHWSRVIEAQWN